MSPINLADVMDDLGTALAAVDGLRVMPYWADRISPPAAVVAWPDPLTYDTTMVRGADRQSVPVHLLVGKVDARTSRDALARFIDGGGEASVKEAIESYEATAYDSARVTQCAVSVMTVAAVDYLAATFTVDIIGTGA